MLCPGSGQSCGRYSTPEGKDYTDHFWQHLCKHQRKRFSRAELQAGKDIEIQPAAQVEPGKQKGTCRIKCLKGLGGVCQEEVLRTSAEPPLWLYIGKTALRFLLCSVLPAIELF